MGHSMYACVSVAIIALLLLHILPGTPYTDHSSISSMATKNTAQYTHYHTIYTSPGKYYGKSPVAIGGSPKKLDKNIDVEPPLHNFSVISGLREYTISIKDATYVEVDLNETRIAAANGPVLSFALNTTEYRDGTYLLNIKYILNNITSSIKLYVIIDNTPPTTRIDVMGIPSGKNNTVIPIHDKNNPHIKYILRNSSGIYFKTYLYVEEPNLAYILFYINNTLYANLTPTDPRAINVHVNHDGLYILRIRAVDKGYNTGQYTLAVRIDTTPPRIFINAPPLITQPGYIRINASIYDYPNSTITALALLNKDTILPTDNVSGPSPLKTSTLIKIENITEDTVFNISFHAIDEALNYAYNYTLIIIDMNPPIIHINITNKSNNYILNTYIIDKGIGIKNVSIKINNKLIYVNTINNKNIYIQLNITKYLVNGNNTIYIITFDNLLHKSNYITYIVIDNQSKIQTKENKTKNINNQKENNIFIVFTILIIIIIIIFLFGIYIKKKRI